MLKVPLLIVSPQVDFGVHLRDGFDPTRIDTFFTADLSQAIQYVRQHDCRTIILDAELEGVGLSVLDIGYALRQIRQDIQFILVTHAGQELDAAFLYPVATLVKPLSIPDLLKLIDRVTMVGMEEKNKVSSLAQFTPAGDLGDDSSQMLWLTDVGKAAQQLTQLTLESSAQAAFITRKNELWAYAGQLSREAAQELTDSIQRYLENQGESDLLRFVRLNATKAQHMLYVRKLSEAMTLALVFDAETPFSKIRSQAGKLVKNLVDSSRAASAVVASVNAAPVSVAVASVAPQQSFTPAIPEAPIRVAQESVFASARPGASLDETYVSHSVSNKYETRQTTSTRSGYEDLQLTQKHQTAVDTFSQMDMQTGPEPAHRILLESPNVSQVNLSYACVLIPRFENHHLVGDLAGRLNEWIPQLCIAYAWRLEYISVRPDYLQWIARVSLNTAAGVVINTIRKHASERIFAEFPRFKADNPSGEFWARGFIVQGGSQPHPQNLINDFINQTRRRQGLR